LTPAVLPPKWCWTLLLPPSGQVRPAAPCLRRIRLPFPFHALFLTSGDNRQPRSTHPFHPLSCPGFRTAESRTLRSALPFLPSFVDWYKNQCRPFFRHSLLSTPATSTLGISRSFRSLCLPVVLFFFSLILLMSGPPPQQTFYHSGACPKIPFHLRGADSVPAFWGRGLSPSASLFF